MLDSQTKKRIDDARQILVGKVPDPKSQVEQITIALVYKFMDDMDRESEAMGGTASFFVKSYAKYSWRRIFAPKLSGAEQLKTYAEALEKLSQNEALPELFREIFKNAYLPYRDPETLRLFLKTIGEFEYDHSERLGDAFEYLLSVLGSQGDAGQFRTPRHIIDFMVEVVDPRKDETILDPACGTAGFLISAWKHIRAANTAKRPGDRLKPADRTRLMDNVVGYDISPDMVRLSLVNLYLHGFARPKVYEYDSLTSLGHWDEHFDVIMANPPFMSPKGGIRPHRKFSVASSRSEVLFVDYIAEHLLPTGRAAVIVPEGIIFQSQGAYVQLRKMLVEDSLVAVVSLPAGVFNPYSGVKTSILFLDKTLARKAGSIAFFKVENDGFGLGAQRRAIDKNDLPKVKAELGEYLARLCAGEAVEDLQPTTGLVVAKEKVAGKGEYNLSGERYREGMAHAGLKWPLIPIGELCVVERGASPRPIHDFITDSPNGVNWIKIGDAEVGAKYISKTKERITSEGANRSRRVKPGDFILSNSMSYGRPYVMATEGCIHDGWLLLRDQSEHLDQNYLYHILGSKLVFSQFEQAATGGVVNNLNSELVKEVRIPLPPLEVQKEIVAEIEGYQKVIDGARAVVDNYRPHIPIRPEWPMVELGNVTSFGSGGTPAKANDSYWIGTIPWVSAKDMKSDLLVDASTHVSEVAVAETATRIAPAGSLLILVRGMGLANGVPICELKRPCAFNQDVKSIQPDKTVSATFLRLMLKQEELQFKRILETAAHGTLKIDTEALCKIHFHLPPLATQQAIVTEIEVEQKLVAANRELIERFEKKIQATLARVWGEETK